METAVPGKSTLDVAAIREEFPILREMVNGKPLVYLDNGATTQKPQAVIDSLVDYYVRYNSNIHRGVHTLSQKATEAYEASRDKVRAFLNASRREEIIFLRGTTEALNLVARSFVAPRLQPGDEILVSEMEHHSNIVPWQFLRAETGAVLKTVPFNDDGELDIVAYERLLGPRTKFVSLVHVSNALGTVNPIQRLTEIAKSHGIPVCVDGAQAAAHQPIDVQAIGCDFYAISGHKVYGPTGIGALYGRHELLEAMAPYQGGGEMIISVTFEETKYNKVPHKFEAGTPDICGAIGLGAAIDWVEGIGLDRIGEYEHELLEYATKRIGSLPGIRIIGTAREKAGLLSFTMENVHPHDVGTILDQEGIAVRVGHHCAQPVMARFGVPATIRASFALYNTREEIDALAEGLAKVQEIFG
jgi:cysteine desulfurase/selenocysteine lyase